MHVWTCKRTTWLVVYIDGVAKPKTPSAQRENAVHVMMPNYACSSIIYAVWVP